MLSVISPISDKILTKVHNIFRNSLQKPLKISAVAPKCGKWIPVCGFKYDFLR
jgi:hypothetical protein